MQASDFLKEINNATDDIREAELFILQEALDLLEKKEAGLIIELPVQIGEICYVIMTDFEDNMRVSRTFFTRTIIEAMVMGEPVFATKEEAEQRLKELRGE